VTEAAAAAPAADLLAWSVEIDDPGDLLSWMPAGAAVAFLRGGDGIVGWGEAVRLATSGVSSRTGAQLAGDVAALLAGMQVRDDVGLPGTGPIAFASLVFDPLETGSVVVVPRVVMGRRDGRSWLTLVTPAREAVSVPQLRRRPVAVPVPEGARIAAELPAPAQWEASVGAAVAEMRAGDYEKVVLARAIDVSAQRPLDPRAVAARLSQRFPSCFTYVCDGLVGASPELLLRRTGRHAESLVLAGTVRRGLTADEDAALERELVSSPKTAHEHAVAAESVRAVLGPLASEVVVEPPALVRLANVTHLGTHVSAWLPAPTPTALDLATALHPTAAVGGTPRDRAMTAIRRLEPVPRGRYAGPVGWVDGRGDGEFAIALRCAQLSGSSARLWAGAGIVAESDPPAEVAETTAKFDAVLSALLG
jgi:menaquinone-specific isochorismate synthase